MKKCYMQRRDEREMLPLMAVASTMLALMMIPIAAPQIIENENNNKIVPLMAVVLTLGLMILLSLAMLTFGGYSKNQSQENNKINNTTSKEKQVGCRM